VELLAAGGSRWGRVLWSEWPPLCIARLTPWAVDDLALWTGVIALLLAVRALRVSLCLRSRSTRVSP